MQKYFRYTTLILITSVLLFTSAYAQIDIKISIMPPYPSKISDYASRPQQVLLLIQNASNLAVDMQLRGTITGDNGIVLRVNPQYKSPAPIHLNAGEIRNLNGSDISQLFDYNQLLFSGISRDAVVRANGLPEGNYQVCVQAFNYYNNQPLSQSEPMGCSNVFPINSTEAPFIISPFNGQAISAQTTQNFPITWSTPAGAPASTQYTVKIVEILDNRNPNDAINTATTPAFFNQTVNGSNLLLYGPSMPSLTPGRSYALVVTAKDPFNTVVFRNGGRSEVIGFTYGATGDSVNAKASTVNNDSNGNIPTLTVKGKINWYYRKSEESQPFTKVKYDPSQDKYRPQQFKGETIALNAALSDPSFVAAVKPATTQSNNSNSNSNPNPLFTLASLKYVKPTAPIVPSAGKQIFKISPDAIGILGGGFSQLSNSNPAFYNNYGSVSQPLANTVIKLYATDTTKPAYSRVPILVQTAQTDAQGNFQISFVSPSTLGSKGFAYSISTENNYFSLTGFSFAMPANTTSYDVGELKALANTYRLFPYALDETKNELIPAIIYIYRRSDFYNTHPALKTEGNDMETNRPDTSIDGKSYKKISAIIDGGNGTRLFYSGGSDDEYKVIVTADRFATYTTALSVASSIFTPSSPVTIREVYDLTSKPTSLSGQVFEQMEQSGQKRAIAGATVTLYLTDEAYNNATQNKYAKMIIPVGMNLMKTQSGTNTNTPTVTKTNQVSTVKKEMISVKQKVSSTGKTSSSNSNNTYKITATDLVNNVLKVTLADHITVTTDSTGSYTISNIPVSANKRMVVARVPGDNLSMTDSLIRVDKGTQLPPMTFEFIFKSYAVTGKVVDEKNNALANARYIWASGGAEAQTDSSGYITSSNKAGRDTIIITKLGYAVRRLPVYIPGALLDNTTQTLNTGTKPIIIKTGGIHLNNNGNDKTNAFFVSLQTTATYKQSVKQGTPISPQGYGFITSTKTNAANDLMKASWVNSITNANDKPSGAVDLDTIVLNKQIGRLMVTVTDNNNNPLTNASIQVDGFDTTYNTGVNGKKYIEGPAGSILVNVSSPSGLSFAPEQVAVTVSVQDTTQLIVSLADGIKISGLVRAGSAIVSGADVTIDGLDYMHAVSDKSGAYSIIVSKNTSYVIKAAKTGFVSDTKPSQSFSGSAKINFTLTTAPFNITTLLGFPVQIDNIEDAANGHKKLTGSFIHLPNNPVFALKQNITIPFSEIEVAIQNNNPVPVSQTINTDVTQLTAKVFNFLPVIISNNGSPIIIRQINNSGTIGGQIEGLPAIDYSSFMPSGIAPYVDANVKQFLQNDAAATPQSIPLIVSNGQLASTSLSISGSSQSFSLYGFSVTLDLAHSMVKNDGLHLKGVINLNNIPLISNTSLQINDLTIGTNGYVSNVSVNMNPAPKIQIATWSASLTGLSFNDNGFNVSGNVQVQIPGSQVSSIDFANLNISTDQIFGGSFTIPSSGIDVFGVVKFVAGSTPLSFGKLGSSNVYYIGGSGSIQFPALFDNIAIKFFQVQTDGQFTATVQTNIDENFFGLADVQITDVGFHTINGIGVDVEGNFLLNAIPFLKASVGGVHFGQGGSVSVDDIGLSFDLVGVANVSANIKFVNQPDKKGFAGDGSIKIIGLTGAEIGFSYYKLPNGIAVSANFKANISIPIGAIVSINNPGGGFSLNTQDHSWSVNINGDVSATGLGTGVNIHVSLTVSNGPVITGTAGLNVLTLNIANAVATLDVPKSLFTININAEIDLIPKVITAEGSAIFTLSSAKNDSYFMIAAQYQSSLLGIFNEKVNIAAGWGLNVNNHPEYAEYTSFIDPVFLDNGVLKGISLNATSDVNFKITGDISIASGSIWYKNNGLVKLNMGIGAGNYGIDVSASWDCGASLSISPIGNVASIDIGSDAGFHLDYSNGCFSAGGDLAAHLSASIGDCDDGCFTGICTDYGFPVGGKICIHPGLKIGYDCNSGFSFGIDL